MLAPLSWLSEFVTLPAHLHDLTDRLTDIGHMLDKTVTVNGETILDLELRGNRSDMFSVYGIARDISAAFGAPLKNLDLAKLPSPDPDCPLVSVKPEVKNLVARYAALTLKVTVGDSPEWIKKRLSCFGLPSINNVVDITNYVMLEIGQTLHAFAADKISGGKLILRQAFKNEVFHTIQQGLDVKLSQADLVIADDQKPQAMTMIGGQLSKVTADTKEIILESAVYDYSYCRKSARSHKIFTASGNIHEKLLDPHQVETALKRAVDLLQKYATAEISGQLSDFYPHPQKPLVLGFDYAATEKLTGVKIPETVQKSFLQSLGFSVSKNNITVPAFRTDITGVADLVEEIIRLYGYHQIPALPLPGLSKPLSDYPETSFINTLKNYLVNLGLDEVIVLPLISEKHADHKELAVYPQNPPDPDRNILRPSLLPGLTEYAQRQINLKNPRVAIFEIGHVFSQKQHKYQENLFLGLVMSGYDRPKNWLKKEKLLTVYDLKGVVDRLVSAYKIDNPPRPTETLAGLFAWEINLDSLVAKNLKPTPEFRLISIYPPVVEDFNFVLNSEYADLESQIKSLSPLITKIELVDKYENKLTLRLTFHDPTRQLSGSDIAGVRNQLLSLLV